MTGTQQLLVKLIRFDNILNWVLGLALVLVPDFFNRLLFGRETISHWILILIGVGTVAFAAWQVGAFLQDENKKMLTEAKLESESLQQLMWVGVAVLVVLGGALLLLWPEMILIGQIALSLLMLYVLILTALSWRVGR